MSWINPLDLQLLFVNTFAGNMEVFMIIAFLTIAALAAYFRMPNSIALIMIALFAIMMAQYAPEFYFVVIVFMAIAILYGIRSYFTK